ncbi:MAG: hypothetical protein ACR2GX_05685 [Candidatus Dormibacteria bacterium]
MADHEPDHDQPEHAGSADGEHGEIHLPPNSFVPVFIAITLAISFVGTLDVVRTGMGGLADSIGVGGIDVLRGLISNIVWLVGVIGLLVTCAVWLMAARNEYLDLPESGGH